MVNQIHTDKEDEKQQIKDLKGAIAGIERTMNIPKYNTPDRKKRLEGLKAELELRKKWTRIVAEEK